MHFSNAYHLACTCMVALLTSGPACTHAQDMTTVGLDLLSANGTFQAQTVQAADTMPNAVSPSAGTSLTAGTPSLQSNTLSTTDPQEVETAAVLITAAVSEKSLSGAPVSEEIVISSMFTTLTLNFSAINNTAENMPERALALQSTTAQLSEDTTTAINTAIQSSDSSTLINVTAPANITYQSTVALSSENTSGASTTVPQVAVSVTSHGAGTTNVTVSAVPTSVGNNETAPSTPGTTGISAHAVLTSVTTTPAPDVLPSPTHNGFFSNEWLTLLVCITSILLAAIAIIATAVAFFRWRSRQGNAKKAVVNTDADCIRLELSRRTDQSNNSGARLSYDTLCSVVNESASLDAGGYSNPYLTAAELGGTVGQGGDEAPPPYLHFAAAGGRRGAYNNPFYTFSAPAQSSTGTVRGPLPTTRDGPSTTFNQGTIQTDGRHALGSRTNNAFTDDDHNVSTTTF